MNSPKPLESPQERVTSMTSSGSDELLYSSEDKWPEEAEEVEVLLLLEDEGSTELDFDSLLFEEAGIELEVGRLDEDEELEEMLELGMGATLEETSLEEDTRSAAGGFR